MQTTTAKPPVGIAYDSNFGDNIDTVLTLGMLRAIASKNDARVIAVSVSKSNIKAAQVEDAVTRFYSGTPVGGGGRGVVAAAGTGGVGVNPTLVGLADNGKFAADTPIINALLSKTTPDGKQAYTYTINRLLDTAEPAISVRNILLAQNDLNAIVIVNGPLTATAELVGLFGAKPQLVAKVRYLVVVAGNFPGNATPDPNVKLDIAAARKAFAEWPTPIYFAGTELGEAIPYPGSSIASDFSWAPLHPVVDAYKAFKPGNYDAAAPGLAASLYAVHPDDGYFKPSEPGLVTVLDDGRLKFNPNPAGKHRYLIADAAQKDKITKLYTELVASKPVAPSFGRGGRGASGAAGASGLGIGASGGRGAIGRGGRGASGAAQ